MNNLFHQTMKKHQSKTFASLYKTICFTRNEAQKDLKADRNLMQRLMNAINFGRPVDLKDVFSHELTKLPNALASTDGKMRSTTKSVLKDILTETSYLLHR